MLSWWWVPAAEAWRLRDWFLNRAIARILVELPSTNLLITDKQHNIPQTLRNLRIFQVDDHIMVYWPFEALKSREFILLDLIWCLSYLFGKAFYS